MTRYVWAWSSHLAQSGQFYLAYADSERELRRHIRETGNVRTTRGVWFTPADEFRAELERLIALYEDESGSNRRYRGAAQRLEDLRHTLEVLTTRITAADNWIHTTR